MASKLKNTRSVDACSICVDKGRKTSDFAVHTHDFSELVIITSGKATHFIDSQEYTVQEGDTFVINGDVLHGYKNVEELQLYNIPFLPERVFANNCELKKMAGFQTLFVLEPYYRKEHEFKSRLALSPAGLKYARELLVLMENEFNEEKEGFMQAVQGFFIALVTFLSREYITIKNYTSRRMISFAEAVAYIESSYTKSIRLQELADMAYFSPRHFVRVFKQNYLLTPNDYMLTLRIKHACVLLRDKDRNMAQIAEESGFTDSNYFSRLFRKKTGFTPSEFRRNSIPGS